MELKYRLLDHPFYKAWTCGEITAEQLSKYHRSYRELISDMPVLWKKVADGLNVNDLKVDKIISEETAHIPLWDNWKGRLPITESYPQMSSLRNVLSEMTASELLGAIHAFEIQQPDVAKTKKDGLTKYYGYKNEELKYFDEHIDEQEHIDLGKYLALNHAVSAEFQKGFDLGSEEFYKALDAFI